MTERHASAIKRYQNALRLAEAESKTACINAMSRYDDYLSNVKGKSKSAGIEMLEKYRKACHPAFLIDQPSTIAKRLDIEVSNV